MCAQHVDILQWATAPCALFTCLLVQKGELRLEETKLAWKSFQVPLAQKEFLMKCCICTASRTEMNKESSVDMNYLFVKQKSGKLLLFKKYYSISCCIKNVFPSFEC